MPLSNVNIRSMGWLEKRRNTCVVCKKRKPEVEVIATFTGMFTGTSKNENYSLHRSCAEKTEENTEYIKNLSDEADRAVAYYKMAIGRLHRPKWVSGWELLSGLRCGG